MNLSIKDEYDYSIGLFIYNCQCGKVQGCKWSETQQKHEMSFSKITADLCPFSNIMTNGTYYAFS